LTKKSWWIELTLLTGSELRMPTRSRFRLSRLFVCLTFFLYRFSITFSLSLFLSFFCLFYLSIYSSVFLSLIHIALSFSLSVSRYVICCQLSILIPQSKISNGVLSPKVFLQCFCHSTYYFCICHISDFRYFSPELTSSISDLFLNG
jgi:hypothetical protein